MLDFFSVTSPAGLSQRYQVCPDHQRHFCMNAGIITARQTPYALRYLAHLIDLVDAHWSTYVEQDLFNLLADYHSRLGRMRFDWFDVRRVNHDIGLGRVFDRKLLSSPTESGTAIVTC